MKLTHCLSAIALACLPVLGTAAPITYTFSGAFEVASEGSTSATTVDFSLVIKADTSGITDEGSGTYLVNYASDNSFTFGTTTSKLINDSLYVGVDASNLTFGFLTGDWLFMGNGGGLDSYVLDTNFGPYSVTTPAYTNVVLLKLQNGDVLTVQGIETVTFTAALDNVVPEPGSFALAGLALAGLALTRRRKA